MCGGAEDLAAPHVSVADREPAGVGCPHGGAVPAAKSSGGSAAGDEEDRAEVGSGSAAEDGGGSRDRDRGGDEVGGAARNQEVRTPGVAAGEADHGQARRLPGHCGQEAGEGIAAGPHGRGCEGAELAATDLGQGEEGRTLVREADVREQGQPQCGLRRRQAVEQAVQAEEEG